MVSKYLKDIQLVQEPAKDDHFTLSTGGKPLRVQIGKKPNPRTLSSETLYTIKRKHDLSDSTIDSIAMECRKDLGRIGVEANSSKRVKEWSRALDEFYTVEKVEFTTMKKTFGVKNMEHTVLKDLVYVKDPESLIDHVCTSRGLELNKIIVRIGIDGGQGSLKVIMNVFDKDMSIYSKDIKDTGVNKVLVLALVKDVSENHKNLQILFQKTKINDLKFSLAADLKLLNIIVGLSAHGGKYSCLYCEGDKSSPGELRTFYSIRKHFESFVQSGSKRLTMKQHKNVVHPCLLEEDGDKYIIDVIPPPELHLLMQTVTKVADFMCMETGIADWMKERGITWHGYNGGGLDGKNANRVLKSLSALDDYVLENYPSYHPLVEVLKSFSTGKCL